MKKYELRKEIIEGILDLCDKEGVFNKEFDGSLAIGFGELYGNNMFSVKSEIEHLFIFTKADFQILFSENYFIEDSEERMFEYLNKMHEFDIYDLAERFDVDVEILSIAFSFLHEIGHIHQYLGMIHRDESIKELDKRMKPLYKKVGEMNAQGLDGDEFYRTIPTEMSADLFAIIFLIDHIEELIDIVQNNIRVVEVEEV